MPVEPQEPWVSFLKDLDQGLARRVELHCIGGFAMTMAYQVSRGTSDIDFLVVRGDDAALLEKVGGRGSELQRRHKVYVHPVGLPTFPENYPDRLVPVWKGIGLVNVDLFALETHDLALTKLERNWDVDRRDVQELARKGLIDAAVLERRYRAEFRPNLVAGLERHDLTMNLWVEMIREVQAPD